MTLNDRVPLAVSNSVKTELISRADLLAELTELAMRSGLLEASLLKVDEAAIAGLQRDLAQVLTSSLSIAHALDELEAAGDDGLTFAADEEPATWIGMRCAVSTAPRLSDVCFACSFELNRALRELLAAEGFDARLAAAETACRKLNRALHAIFTAAKASSADPLLGAQLLERRMRSELERAVAVRRLFGEFRLSLRRAENDSVDAVLTALRYAAGAVALLTASPHHASIRVSDRALLRRLRDRLLEWSRAGKPAAEGLQLLEDIWTCADLLRDINRRQELCAHDAELIRSLASNPQLDQAGWLASLDRLRGLDDALDALTERLRREPGSSEHMVEIMLRLSLLM